MTRQEGIIKQYMAGVHKRIKNVDQLLSYEYNQYCELCFYCHEKPVSQKEWLSQTINPAK